MQWHHLLGKFYYKFNFKLEFKIYMFFFYLAPVIPWSGYLIGGIVAWLTKRPLNQVKTIAIETGIQNVGVAFLIVLTNFPV